MLENYWSDKKLIWILEDDVHVRFIYEDVFELRYETRFFSSLRELGESLRRLEVAPLEEPSLLIADLRLGDGNFLNFKNTNGVNFRGPVPVLVVSSTDDLDVLRACFEGGVSDYLTKPFSKNQLIVKVEQILKPKVKTAEETASDIIVDPVHLKLKRGHSESIQLTAKEIQVFAALYRSKDQPLSRSELISIVWQNINVSNKALDVHLHRLRRKIAPLGIEIIFVAPDGFALSDVRKLKTSQDLPRRLDEYVNLPNSEGYLDSSDQMLVEIIDPK